MGKRGILFYLLMVMVLTLTVPGMGRAMEEPSLPLGLGGDSSDKTEEPALPEGLGVSPEEKTTEEKKTKGEALPFLLTGFWEGRIGVRTQKDSNEKDLSIGETRLQLQLEQEFERSVVRVTSDLLFDPVLDRHSVRLEEGKGFLDLREANLLIRPLTFTDLKVGRQILTWGTGDLIFINDLFPKDWNAFFIGRDPEYLKAPSDAIKLSFFFAFLNLDVVYTPRFDSDRFIDGSRISFYNGLLGLRSGRDAVVSVDKREDWFEEDEVAWRIYKNIRGYEVAAYGYKGYWKSPGGVDPILQRVTFPPLSVYGASVRGAVGRGIGNLELGYYDSENDRSGENPLIRNGEFRFLAGYEQEVFKNFTVALQYYLEYMLDHEAYLRTLPMGSPGTDENRHVLTVRFTHLLMNQNLILSFFTFYSPSDEDAYLRPKVHYKVTDAWSAEVGGNVFVGKEDHTFFGQFEKNSNVFTGVRYSF
jgi:hypothetical protein